MIVTFTNRKGGVGKSTMASHTAAYLAMQGLRVGLVDTDSQGHAGKTFNIPEADGLYNLLINGAHIEDVTIDIPPECYSSTPETAGLLALLPSSDKTHYIPNQLPPDQIFVFLDAMRNFRAAYNLHAIIIDTSPSLSLFDGAIYMATDGFVYVTECSRLSIDGLQRAIQQMLNVQRTRQTYMQMRTEIIGIIANKMRPNTKLHRGNLGAIVAAYKTYVWTPVRLLNIWDESSNNGQPVWMIEPKSEATVDAYAIGERVMQAVQSW